jgi:hypothetical protein
MCGVPLFELVGESDIAQARSALASRWLAMTNGLGIGEWSLWLDDDVAVDPEDLTVFANRAVESDFDIVAGLYAGKSPASGLVTSRFMSSPVVVGEQGGLIDIAACGFGCVMVRRRVFETLGPALPLVKYARKGWGEVIGRPYFLGMVVRDQEDPDGPGIHLGEDFAFCYRARKAGFGVVADTRLRVGHVGRYVYHLEDVGNAIEHEKSMVLHVSGVMTESGPGMVR